MSDTTDLTTEQLQRVSSRYTLEEKNILTWFFLSFIYCGWIYMRQWYSGSLAIILFIVGYSFYIDANLELGASMILSAMLIICVYQPIMALTYNSRLKKRLIKDELQK